MSVINREIVKDYYNKDPNTRWYSVNFKKIDYKDQALEVANQCTSDARMERLKALSKVIMGGGVALLLTGASIIAYKIATMAIGIFVFPLMILPPLYGLVTALGGLGVGGAVFYFTTAKYSEEFFNQAKEHWNYANHLYSQAHLARIKAPELSSAKA
ncbi:MAG: hypothetical protein K940chlam6_01563 [Chlamydiae bacterium]|nr:hypothetical protein [Chlamydiota bacterium]